MVFRQPDIKRMALTHLLVSRERHLIGQQQKHYLQRLKSYGGLDTVQVLVVIHVAMYDHQLLIIWEDT